MFISNYKCHKHVVYLDNWPRTRMIFWLQSYRIALNWQAIIHSKGQQELNTMFCSVDTNRIIGTGIVWKDDSYAVISLCVVWWLPVISMSVVLLLPVISMSVVWWLPVISMSVLWWLPVISISVLDWLPVISISDRCRKGGDGWSPHPCTFFANVYMIKYDYRFSLAPSLFSKDHIQS
jgi:hypothetical protein